MKFSVLTAAAILLSLSFAASAQSSDRELMLGKSFDGKLISEQPPRGANAFEKASWFISNQLVGRDFYSPANYMFLRDAVRRIGLIPAFFATADRILRDSRIGTASTPTGPDNPIIEEGPEAYAPWREGR